MDPEDCMRIFGLTWMVFGIGVAGVATVFMARIF